MKLQVYRISFVHCVLVFSNQLLGVGNTNNDSVTHHFNLLLLMVMQ